MDTDLTRSDVAQRIIQEALKVGFLACGFATVNDVHDNIYNHWQQWIAEEKHAGMHYMAQHATLRRNPQGLLPSARTVIVVALNYYPACEMPRSNPRFARYAYGNDYHDVMRQMLGSLAQFVQTIAPCECRCCCDTAPIFERYWATQAGIGFIGRNSQLIIPHHGSYFFLGEIITTLDIAPSTPIAAQCGECRRCIDACPVQAIGADMTIDARRCISCQTIENRGEIPPFVASRLGRRVYGCDTCQEVCPHNSHATGTTIEALQPIEELDTLTYETLIKLTPDDFRRIFRHSAIKRAKYEGLMRNIKALKKEQFD